MYANVIKLEARADRVGEAADWLSDAATRLAHGEAAIRDFYVVRASGTSFWIFDTFETGTDRDAHAQGPVAAELLARADELLSAPPEITPGEVIALDESRTRPDS